jgi:hypothetical protein
MKKLTTILTITLFIISCICLASESGALDPVPFPKAGKPGPVAKSKFFVLESTVNNGMAEVSFSIDTPRKAMIVVLGEKSAQAFSGQKALSPMSFNDEELSRVNIPADNTRFNLDTLSPGKQSLTLQGLTGEKYVRMVVAQPESPLELEVQVAPLAPRSGDKVTVTAQIKDEALPAEADIKGILADQTSFNLQDNGLNGDETAGDGIYTGTFIAPTVEGFEGINIHFTADGKRLDGMEFRRNVLGTVMVTNPVGKILKESIAVRPESIMVPLKDANGKFRVEILFGVNGTALAYSREETVQAGEVAAVTLPLPQAALAADRAIVRLLNMQTLGLEDEFEIQLTPIQAAPDFNAIPRETPQMPKSKALAIEKLKKEKNTQSSNH